MLEYEATHGNKGQVNMIDDARSSIARFQQLADGQPLLLDTFALHRPQFNVDRMVAIMDLERASTATTERSLYSKNISVQAIAVCVKGEVINKNCCEIAGFHCKPPALRR